MSHRESMRTWGIVLVASVAAMQSGHAGELSLRTRQQEIARLYVGAYDTVHRLDAFSRHPERTMSGRLSDDAYFKMWFQTSALDARTSIMVEMLDDLSFRDLSFFEAYNTSSSPPEVRYVIGVDTRGAVFRLRGFEASDFLLLVRDEPLTSIESVVERVRLFYRLSSSLRPGPILSASEATNAISALERIKGSEQLDAKTLIHPAKIDRNANGWDVETYVVDVESTRLESHLVHLELSGAMAIKDRRIIRDVFAPSY